MTPESIPGIIAGLHSHNSAQINDDVALKSLPDNQPTLASWLSSLGYETSAVLSNSQLTEERNYNLGFDDFQNLTSQPVSGADSDASGDSLKQRALTYCKHQIRSNDRLLSPFSLGYILYRWQQSRTDWPTPTADEVVDETRTRIRNASSKFFVWSHFMDPHGPYHPDVFEDLAPYKGMIADCGRANQIQTRWLDDAYDSAVAYVDREIKRIVTALKEEGEWENTIFIVTSDHGEALDDRGWIGHVARHYLFNELLHVPLLIHHPEYDADRFDDPVSLAWLSEIIAEAIGAPPPGFPADGPGGAYFEASDEHEFVIADGLDEQGHSVAAIDASGKYIAHSPGGLKDYRSPVWHDDGTYYDLLSDPHEENPLHENNADEDLIQVAQEPLTDAIELPSVDAGLSADAEERLRDIGYL